MYKKIFLFLIAVVLILGSSKISLAGISEPNIYSGNSINVGNKICPVSGEKIEEKMKATYEYNGKVYNFCCEGCIKEFKKNAGKYIKIIDEDKNNPRPIKNK